MYKIRYYYSSLAKQCFLCVAMVSIAARFALFFAGGFYKEAYTGATVAVYLLLLALCIFFLVAWKLFYYEFNESTITGRSLLTKKKTELDLEPVERALFSKSGVSLFYQGDETPRFFIPFRRFGAISPVGVENFMNLMKNHRVKVEQEYSRLPGCGPAARWFSRFFMILSVLFLINAFQYGVLVFLILTK